MCGTVAFRMVMRDFSDYQLLVSKASLQESDTRHGFGTVTSPSEDISSPKNVQRTIGFRCPLSMRRVDTKTGLQNWIPLTLGTGIVERGSTHLVPRLIRIFHYTQLLEI